MTKRSFIHDKNRVLQSSFNDFYPAIKILDSFVCESYLTLGPPLSFIRAFAGCRLSGKHSFSITINKVFYKISILEKCTLCNVGVNETLMHILTECPIYLNLRKKYDMDMPFVEMLSDCSVKNVSQFYYYLSSVLKLRSFILCE